MKGSELTDVITDAKIQASGSFKAILSATLVKKTRYVNQANVAVLYSMLKESCDDSEDIDFEEWIDTHRKKSPYFEFRYTLLELECLVLMSVLSLRSDNFKSS